MAYNTLKGKVNFSNSTTGSIESMVDDYSAQTIAGVKTFSSTVSASAFYDTTTSTPLGASALTAIASDGARRVIVSDGDGTATCYSNLVYNGTTLTASFSGSAAALTNIPLEPYKVSGQLSASNIYFGSGLQDSSNKIAVQGGNSITVGASGVAVDLATTGGLAHDAGKLKVSPNDATTKASTSNSDLFIIADSDASNATKKITATVLGTYMQNALTFTTPGGSDAQLQYKNGSAFAGSSNLTFNTNTLTTVNVSASGHVSSSLFVGNGSGLTNVTTTHPPAGVDTNVQFNSGSTFSGSSNLNFNYAAGTPVLQITGDLSASNDLAIGRDSLVGRDATVMRNIITYGNVSASSNISASNFYGNGQTLANVPISNYTSTRLVFCGASTNTLDAFNGLTWANPLLSVPGKVSSTQASASLGVTGSSLHTLNTVINSTHVSSSLNISGSKFYGDGSQLTGISGGGGISFNGSTANGVVTYGGATQADVESNLTFDGTDLGVSDKIFHIGDTDTYLDFTDDKITVKAGNREFLTITEAGTDTFVINGGSGPVNTTINSDNGDLLNASTAGIIINDSGMPGHDFRVESNQKQNAIYLDADLQYVHLLADGASPAGGLGADMCLFVSGTAGSRGTSTRGTAVFGGDVVITGSLFAGNLTGSKGALFNDDVSLTDDKKINLGDSADALIEFDSGIGKLAISGSAAGIELKGGGISLDYPGGTVASGSAAFGSFLAMNASNQVVLSTPHDPTIVLKSNGTHSITTRDRTILCNTSGGKATCNLPAAAGALGLVLTFKKILGGDNVDVAANGSETIDGAAINTLTAVNQSVTIQCNGTSWYILSNYVP